jgi:two-component system, chemotaxis family, protein-glutamate methylesterase/glutaminase
VSSSPATSPPIRVLIADDSAVARTALSRMLESAPSVQVCGTARNGLEALEKVRQLRPDVVTLDVEMPVLNGLDVLKRIMKEFPRPVIMISSLTRQGAEVTIQALGVGAFDYLPKSDSGVPLDPQKLQHDLIAKIEAAAHSPLAREVHASNFTPQSAIQTFALEESRAVPEMIVLGTSTGGPKVLQEFLPELPADLPVGMLVVQHMPPGFTAPFARRLDSLCKLKVREAQHGETIDPGMVYIAPAGQHTTLGRRLGTRATMCLSMEPTGTLHKPSVDVTMLSAAKTFGSQTLGIIMTGMGSDGLQGMTAIHDAGGITIGQDEATCAVYGMPRCCAENGILDKVVPLPQLSRQILHILRYRPRQ